MVKVALLIGVSQYEPGLTALPSAVRNVAAMQRVLQNPETGGFEQVKVLSNPTPMSMQKAIEMMFSDLAEDDLGLLYFSGHGLKDENGRVYFATRYTRKDATGGLLRATAFPASSIQDILNKSRCQQQVIVLDCSFSRAYSETSTTKTDDFVDVATQLGGKRRGILTASTSTLDTLEAEWEELSVYTRYLAEGIETGTADADSNGAIILDELHDYARQKVQETAPAIQPKLFAEPTAAKIIVAQASVNDPKFRYRQQVERLAHRGKISDEGRHTLDALRSELDLAPDQTAVIEAKVLNPYQKYQKKLERYGQVFLETLRRESPVSPDARLELEVVQKSLQLRNEDVAKVQGFIERKFFPDGAPTHSPSDQSSQPSPPPPPPPPSFLSSKAAPDTDSQQIAPSELTSSPLAPEFSQVVDPIMEDSPLDALTGELGLPDQSPDQSYDLPEFDDLEDSSISSELPTDNLDIFDDLADLPDADVPSLDLGDSVDFSASSKPNTDDFNIFDDLADLSDADMPSLDLGDSVDVSSLPVPDGDELDIFGELADLSDPDIPPLDLEDEAELPTPSETLSPEDLDIFNDFSGKLDSDLPSLDLEDTSEASNSDPIPNNLDVFDDFAEPSEADLPSVDLPSLDLGDMAEFSSSPDSIENALDVFDDFADSTDAAPTSGDSAAAELPGSSEPAADNFDIFDDFAEPSDADSPLSELGNGTDLPGLSDPPTDEFDIFEDVDDVSGPAVTDIPSLEATQADSSLSPTDPYSEDIEDLDPPSEATDAKISSLEPDDAADLSNPFAPLSEAEGVDESSVSTDNGISPLDLNNDADFSNPFAPLYDGEGADDSSASTDDVPALGLDEPESAPSPPEPLSAAPNDLPGLPDADLNFLALDLDEEEETPPELSKSATEAPFDSEDPLAGLPDADLLSMDLSEEGNTGRSDERPVNSDLGALVGLPDADLLSLNLDEDSAALNSADQLIDEFDDIGKLPESEPASFEADDEGIATPNLAEDLVDELEAPSRPGPLESELNASETLPQNLSEQRSDDAAIDEFPVSPDTDLPQPDLNADASSPSPLNRTRKWFAPAAVVLGCFILAIIFGPKLFRSGSQTPAPTASESSGTSPASTTSPAAPSTTGETADLSPAALYQKALDSGIEAATLAQSAQSQADWQKVVDEWGNAIAFLKKTRSDDANAAEKARQKIAEYEQNQAIAQQQADRASWRQAISTAEKAGQRAGTAQTSADWNQVADTWGDAIALLQSIPESNPNYNASQTKIAEYQRNREIAKRRASRN
ncbi:MAG: caspase family protein [Leptolyngbyaceae cyanobacterium MO_188.B28]|nr:caspase family protein [Leptolyngbyaceae cyanobacterium MO_188.B28]